MSHDMLPNARCSAEYQRNTLCNTPHVYSDDCLSTLNVGVSLCLAPTVAAPQHPFRSSEATAMDGDPEDWPADPQHLRQLDRSLRCQICGDIYTGPVALACGHSCKFILLKLLVSKHMMSFIPCIQVVS